MLTKGKAKYYKAITKYRYTVKTQRQRISSVAKMYLITRVKLQYLCC